MTTHFNQEKEKNKMFKCCIDGIGYVALTIIVLSAVGGALNLAGVFG